MHLKLSRYCYEYRKYISHNYEYWYLSLRQVWTLYGYEKKLGDAWLDKDGRVFTGDDGAPLFPDSITAWFTKFIKRTGMPKVTVHSLRHTYASIMIADGMPLVVVSHQLGHAQASTTANIYAHVIASAEARAAQTFDRFNDILTPGAGELPAPEPMPGKVKKIG